jgi:hypothetical protein
MVRWCDAQRCLAIAQTLAELLRMLLWVLRN